jgi:DNA-binding beta-propeller fold protein YncE
MAYRGYPQKVHWNGSVMNNDKRHRRSAGQGRGAPSSGGVAPRPGRIVRATAGVLLVLLLAACAAPEREEVVERKVLAYPPPPETPRFFYERSIVGTASVVEFTEEMSLRQILTGTAGVQNEPLAKPFSVAVHQGRVFVSDSTSRAVKVFDYAAKKAMKIGNVGAGALAVPLGMDTDAAGNLYVADVSQKRVAVYDRDGEFLRAFGGKELLDRPGSVAVTPDGTRAFVADTGGVQSQNHHIAVFDPRSGDHLYNIGTRGAEPGQFNLLREVALGPDGRLYAVDGGNFRIQVFEQDGTFVRTFGQAGRQFGQFARPKGIDVGPDGNVYVVDAAFGNFQIFTPEGELLLFVGQRANRNAPGVYSLPAGIAVDEDGRVYVVEQFYPRVDIFRPAALAADAGYLVTGPPAAAKPAPATKP